MYLCTFSFHTDPNPLPLTESPWPLFIILASYIIFVQKLGRDYMKNREPYDLRKILYVYNLSQVAFNSIFFAVSFYYIVYSPIYNWSCMETFPPGHEHRNFERYLYYAYYFNKLLDLLDTVFFLLRKSYKQISFLHVYHHVMVITFCYWAMRFYGAGGHLNSIQMVNSFVHAVMYMYYFLSALYPGTKAIIESKKYITITQLVQFVIVFGHASYVLLFPKGCGYPKRILQLIIIQSGLMMYMFGTFYIKSYLRPAQRRKQG
ncbi:hypothetical protein KR222_010145 [Zaprionus bogoriensis]|nr:hypothetical protein KR222_010145 [Zaprionus bogoriensis]